MRKISRSVAVLAAFIMGIGCGPFRLETLAAQNENGQNLFDMGGTGSLKEDLDFFQTGEAELSWKIPNLLEAEGTQRLLESAEGEKKERKEDKPEGESPGVKPEAQPDINQESDKDRQRKDMPGKPEEGSLSEIENLQIPPELGVVIDPWEMDGGKQIYSEQYLIKNTGQNSGMLTLSNLTCVPQTQGKVAVKTGPECVHDGSEKSVYMQMVFGNGDQITLTEEASEYKTRLEPGEELSVCFTGEVNEYAAESWKDDDLAVNVIYSWEVDEILPDKSAEEEKESSEGEGTEQPEEDIIEDDQIEIGQPEESEEENLAEESLSTEFFALYEPTELKWEIDSWEADESGTLCSAQYTVRNAGETTGMLELTRLLCETGEESRITVLTDRDSLNDTEEEVVYMELMMGNSEKLVFPQELPGQSPEGTKELGYQIELEPGEEWEFRLVGELSGVSPEEVKDGDIRATVLYSWKPMNETESE